MSNQEFTKLLAEQNKAWQKIIVILERLNDDAQRNLDLLREARNG